MVRFITSTRFPSHRRHPQLRGVNSPGNAKAFYQRWDSAVTILTCFGSREVNGN